MQANQSENQILWDACCSGDLDTVKKYVDKVDLNWRNPQYVRLRFCNLKSNAKSIVIIGILQGCTMLHIAALYHNEQVVSELLRKGASTDIASKVDKRYYPKYYKL